MTRDAPAGADDLSLSRVDSLPTPFFFLLHRRLGLTAGAAGLFLSEHCVNELQVALGGALVLTNDRATALTQFAAACRIGKKVANDPVQLIGGCLHQAMTVSQRVNGVLKVADRR